MVSAFYSSTVRSQNTTKNWGLLRIVLNRCAANLTNQHTYIHRQIHTLTYFIRDVIVANTHIWYIAGAKVWYSNIHIFGISLVIRCDSEIHIHLKHGQDVPALSWDSPGVIYGRTPEHIWRYACTLNEIYYKAKRNHTSKHLHLQDVWQCLRYKIIITIFFIFF